MSQYDPNSWQNQPGGYQPPGGQPGQPGQPSGGQGQYGANQPGGQPGYGDNYGANPGGYPQPSGYPQPGGGYPSPYVQQDAPSATLALVFGILGFFCIIPAILAIVWGNRTKQEIAASGGQLGGAGKGQAGVILGWISIGLTVVYLVVVLAGGVLSNT